MAQRFAYNYLPWILLYLIILFIGIYSCKKDELNREAKIKTKAVSEIMATSATATGDIIDIGEGISDYGHCWSISEDPTITDSLTSFGTVAKTGVFTSNLQELISGKKYYIRAYLISKDDIIYGSNETFTTLDGLATLTTTEVTNIKLNSAICGGNIISVNGDSVLSRGICWDTLNTVSLRKKLGYTINGSGLGVFSSEITGLERGVTYYIKAWAITSIDTSYGDLQTFTTLDGNPTIVTSVISEITAFTATCGGEIYSDNGSTVTARGVCWSTSPNPTVNDSLTIDGTGIGSFNSNLANLDPGITYYVRAYATNVITTSYGNEQNFTTKDGIPTLTTAEITNITSNSAISGGSITDDGGADVTTCGICYSTTANPTINDSKTVDSASEGVFTSILANLSNNTLYYVRAYAVNSIGNYYGDELSFTTRETFTDVDGNVYDIIAIGTQIWMAENLKTTKYNDGTDIPNVIDNSMWSDLTTGAYSDINNLPANSDIYGRLYNWYAVISDNNLCPTGWHVPTDDEWTTLVDYLGGESVAGGKLKETGTAHWTDPNIGATNETGFTALPGGFRGDDGTFNQQNGWGFWWNSNEYTSSDAWSRYMYYQNSAAVHSYSKKKIGFSIRCIKGDGYNLPIVTTSAITDITSSTATSGGNITSDNGASVTERGICWSTSENPTIADNVATDSNIGAGSFTCYMTDLVAGTTYYVRAYATNSVGTAYGDAVSFITQGPPSVSTGSATSVTSVSAILNGTVNANNLSTTVTFEYGLTTSYGSEITANESPITGNTATAVTTDIGSLTASTTYHFRVKAVSTGGTTYGNDMEFTTVSALPTVTDYDGNTYNIITIGTQDWIQENLKTTHYNNGEAIANVTGDTEWEALTTGAYCWYNNSEGTYKDTYGALYNWYTTIDVRNICPAGWHVPTDDEWTTLSNYLGGESIAGGKLKEIGTTHWVAPNSGATNESGFTALPGGYRSYDGGFSNTGVTGFWWTSNEYNTTASYYRWTSYSISDLYGGDNSKNDGYSIRCIKGELPLAKIDNATGVSATSAILNGQVNPNNASTTVTFEYGETISYGSEVTASESPLTGTVPGLVSAGITSLNESTTYHCRVKVVNSGGTTYSEDNTFTTMVKPIATTESATSVTSAGATLNGTINANDLSTTVTFEYGLTTSYGSEITANESPVTGNTATAVTADLGSLTASTTYYFRVKAVSTGGTTYGNDMEFTTVSALSTVTDYDGNTYNIITIGTQDWIQENLKTTHYNNGEAIANVTDDTEWEALTTGAYCWYNNSEGTYKDTYGALYNWYTIVDIRNVCPAGWHVPTDGEWTTLIDYLGGSSIAGGKLKETGTAHWTSPNTGATDETGFSALPGGDRGNSGPFTNIGHYGNWWSTTEYSDNFAEGTIMYYDVSSAGNITGDKKSGFSIRCLEGALPLVQTGTSTAVASASATLKGMVNPNGASTIVTYEYGTSTAYGSTVTTDQSPASGSDPVYVSAGLTSLIPGTTYHYRIKAENSYGTNYGTDMTFTTTEQISDADGNIYSTVIIGDQTWMQENLKTTQYNDVSSIPLVTNGTSWSNLTTPGYCWYDNDESTYGDTYGALYNWYAVNTGKLCPSGWHVPSNTEWTTLITYLGGESEAGGKIKEAGTSHWSSPNIGATNESGLTALPGGFRDVTFNDIFSHVHWWTSTEEDSDYADLIILLWVTSDVSTGISRKYDGSSIRCIKD